MSKASFFDHERSIFVSGLHSKVTEEILWELFLQAGPLENVRIPKDKDTGKPRTFGFVVYQDFCSVAFACELFNSLKLFGKPINCKPQNSPAQKSSPGPNETGRSSPGRSPNENGKYPNEERGWSRNQESHSSKESNNYSRNQINFNLQRSFSMDAASPLMNPLLAQTLFHQHLQMNQLRYGGAPESHPGPMRRHTSMYDRRPVTSRTQRRQQTHPY